MVASEVVGCELSREPERVRNHPRWPGDRSKEPNITSHHVQADPASRLAPKCTDKNKTGNQSSPHILLN